jgi:exodeoxyribonuclease VII large subunit
MKWVTAVINRQEVSIAFDENSIHIYNAFPIKDDLKMRGYRWNPGDKSWFIRPTDVDKEIGLLQNNLSTSSPVTVQSVIEGTVNASPSELAVFPDSYSVADLRNRLDRLIREGIRGNVWVRGVIASDVKEYKWASYLDLKDEDDSRNIFFRMEVKRSQLEKINRKLADSGVANQLEKDLPVFCSVEVYLPLRNVIDVRLSLLDILPEYTQSKIRNQRDITLDALREEGILENQKTLQVPALISRIGLITSEQGTSIRDIRAGLSPYDHRYHFYFVDSRMEGSAAVDSVIQALYYLEQNHRDQLDVIIIARGGGSEQSLAVFNDLKLCRSVCHCSIPVLTAIGHEKDVSAIEMCSWFTPTPSTPSGIGKYLQNRFMELQEQLSGTMTRLVHHFSTVHHREMEKIRGHLKFIPERISGYLKGRKEHFVTLTGGLRQAVLFTVRDQERRIASLSGQLTSRYRDRVLKTEQGIQSLSAQLVSRGTTLHRRERLTVEKTILRLDFEKQYRNNLKQENDLQKYAAAVLTGAQKKVTADTERLTSRMQLVKASSPENVLKKGFSLVMDENNRVLKSVNDFNRIGKAVLRFHDGTAKIKNDSE